MSSKRQWNARELREWIFPMELLTLSGAAFCLVLLIG